MKDLCAKVMRFGRWRDSMLVLGLGLLAVSTAFFLRSLQGPVMTPEVYGKAVYIIPAEAWSLAIMFGAVMQVIGAAFNHRGAVTVGAFVFIQTFGTFAYLSSSAGYGDVVTLFAGLLFVPIEVFFLAVSAVSIGGKDAEN